MKINKGYIYQKDAGKITIFDGEKSVFYNLNTTASFIFNKLKQGHGEEEIIADLVKKYKISSTVAGKDLKDFIDDAKKKKILE